jgi:hypothetical protein
VQASGERVNTPDYIDRIIETVRNHRDADNSWPQWANHLADEVVRLREELQQRCSDLAQRTVDEGEKVLVLETENSQLVGRLEQAERTVTNLEQAFTAAREDLKQKDEALRRVHRLAVTCLDNLAAGKPRGSAGTEIDFKRLADFTGEALGVPPQPQDSGASRAGRSEDGA